MWFMLVAVGLGLVKTLAFLNVLMWPWAREMSWLWVLGTSAAAVLWWWWADNYGYTQRKSQARMDERSAERRKKRAQRMQGIHTRK